MDLELKGKTAIITGGSRGIGKAAGREFGLEGMKVALVARGSESLEDCARELREETGYAGEGARLLSFCRPNSAILSNRCFFALVEKAEKVDEVAFDPNEEIETVLVPLDEIPPLIRSGEISHSLALNALFLLFLERGLPLPT